jgi:predicted metal-binding membrane protein
VKTIAHLLPNHRFLWLTFFACVLAAWSILFAMQARFELPAGWQDLGPAYLLWLCSGTAADAGFMSALLMWSLMTLAMMAPTAFPAFRTFSDLTHTDAASELSLTLLVAGYLTVWFGFSVFAALFQIKLASLGLLNLFGQSTSGTFNGSLLILAGLYQFSSLKNACLSACQNPMTFFFSHWQPGLPGAVRLGLRLGAVCLGCCWALMLLAFVAGTMNLLFMWLAMVLMTLEKLPQIGAKISTPLGVFLLIAGATVFALPFTT